MSEGIGTMAKQKIVRIASRREGFRRAGLAHPAQPVEHPADSFTPDQLAALKAEPMLMVDELERPAAEPAEPAGDGKAKKAKE